MTTRQDATDAFAGADVALAAAADAYLIAAGLHDAGALPRLEYLRARRAFRTARAKAQGLLPVQPSPGPCIIYDFAAERAKRRPFGG